MRLNKSVLFHALLLASLSLGVLHCSGMDPEQDMSVSLSLREEAREHRRRNQELLANGQVPEGPPDTNNPNVTLIDKAMVRGIFPVGNREFETDQDVEKNLAGRCEGDLIQTGEGYACTGNLPIGVHKVGGQE